MDWLYLALMIAFVAVSVALVHGFERLRNRAGAATRALQTEKQGGAQ